MVQNNSKNKPYYTQRNNALKPNCACNVTAMIAALLAAGYAVEQLATEKFRQPEDALMDFIVHDERTLALWKVLDPSRHNAPNEWHPVLALGTNLFLRERGLVGKDVNAVEWGEWRSKSQITETIRNGGAAVLSGLFPAGGRKTIGHVVACVGFKEDDEGNITHFIIDDSWGNYHT
ncbi:MAG: C39 family peptidase, partial [Treponema sp.]|nr:C39 family peptidase [Treponema sp.]